MPLTDAQTLVVIAEYVVFITITVLFSLLSLDSRDTKKMIFSALAMVMWFMTGLIHLAISPVDYVTQVAPSVLFFGFGLIWLILLVKTVTESMAAAYTKKYQVDSL